MELNRAQLLVHDDEALNKFRIDHRIPDDAMIERSGPNEIANFVKGNGDRILVQIWLIHQDWFWFPISPILKAVMARYHLTFMQVSVNFVRTVFVVNTLMHQMELPFSAEDLLHVYTVVRPKREPHSPLPQGNHYLRLRHPNQPQTRLDTSNLDKDLFVDEFVWVSGNWEFQARDDGRLHSTLRLGNLYFCVLFDS